MLGRIAARLGEVGLRLHPDKTRIVYCKDGRRRDQQEHVSFTFLGYAFRARGARTKDGRCFTSFLPAISPEALKAKSARLRELRIHRRTDLTLDGLARWLNPIIAGWIRYVAGRFDRSALNNLLKRVNTYLRRWAGRKYKTAPDPPALQQVVDRAAHPAARPIRSLARGPLVGLIRRAR